MGRPRRAEDHNDDWSARDEILVWTCRLVTDVQAERPRHELPRITVSFPPAFHPAEQFFASGPFQLSDYRALGDGSWSVPGYLAVGRPSVVMGAAIGHSMAKRRAQAAAAAASVPRWVAIERGTLFVSSHGWYMHTPNLLWWDWKGMTSAAMVAPATLHLTGESQHGPISWLLHSDWAELVFALWALHRHPQHPQLATGLPPRWTERAQHHLAQQGTRLPFPG